MACLPRLRACGAHTYAGELILEISAPLPTSQKVRVSTQSFRERAATAQLIV